MSGARLGFVLVIAAALWGCKSTPAERPAELEEAEREPERVEPPPPAVAQPEPAAVSGETPSAAQLPVAEDFQAETAAAIVRSNYRTELDALESELRADGE